MKRSNILAAVAAAITFSAGTALAAPATTPSTTAPATDKEPCKVVDKSGVGLIKPGMGECKSSKHSCAGQNVAGDAEAWVSVPKGQCAKINAGDMSGVTQEVKDKIVTN